MWQYNINVILRLISLVSVTINWFNLRIMGNVLGIIGTFLENYQGFLENLRIALYIKISIIYLPLMIILRLVYGCT